jgi:hypothetical protein
MTTPSRPLWRVMYDAYYDMLEKCEPMSEGLCYAAELRAIADWLVPEEPLPHGPGQKERCNIRAILLAEAARSEAGE